MTEDATPTLPDDSADTAKKRDTIQTLGSGDRELQAIGEIVAALNSLTEEQRFSALDYVLRRFKAPAMQYVTPQHQDQSGASPESSHAQQAIRRQEPDIG